MIIVHGVIPIVPERRKRALQLAREMSDATQLEQIGRASCRERV